MGQIRLGPQKSHALSQTGSPTSEPFPFRERRGARFVLRTFLTSTKSIAKNGTMRSWPQPTWLPEKTISVLKRWRWDNSHPMRRRRQVKEVGAVKTGEKLVRRC